ncbi:pilus assembly PilX family protein [Halomonas nitroreducens]|uniref:Type 4 fimbrial biogenesis protein PilX N-terminal domain-containing protein n=1 Tax=Halomonas nitroreducens TaxID=447425 RepID=A0A431V129_9GAMM|nr:pilus assembly PilX N-terminal domain-containing protein [Halomonas nitroreducens]RTR01455.1 hypothetical protein EKG36_13745 [Halomonas nitroreducens]
MKSQKGMALIVSLIVLVVAALLGLSSYQSSQLEERMAGNHRFSVSALQAAEVGINKMLGSVVAYSYSPGSEFCDDMGGALSATGFTSEGAGYTFSDDVAGGDLDVSYKAYMECGGSGHVLGFSRGAVFNSDGDELSARRVRVEIVPPGYDYINSMLGNGINLTGNSTIVGDVHSNTDVTLSLQATGNPEDRVVSEGSITSTGDMNIDGSDSPDAGECTDVVCAASGVPARDIPSAQDRIDKAKKLLLEDEGILTLSAYTGDNPTNPDNPPEYDPIINPLDEEGNSITVDNDEIKILPHDANGDCDIDAAGEFAPVAVTPDDGPGMGSKIYHCPGVLTVTGDFGGVTIMAEGGFVHNGAISIGDTGEIDTFVVSGGNIELNGGTGTETYAAFLSEGDFIQNGDSKVYGTIVATGSITANGGMDFEARETGKILVPVSGHLDGWVELEDPADDANITS